jgi:hypothetical protein
MTLSDPTLIDALKKGRIVRSRQCDLFAVTGIVHYKFMRGTIGYCIARTPDDKLSEPELWIVSLDDIEAYDWFVVSESVNIDLVDKIKAFRALQTEE